MDKRLVRNIYLCLQFFILTFFLPIALANERKKVDMQEMLNLAVEHDKAINARKFDKESADLVLSLQTEDISKQVGISLLPAYGKSTRFVDPEFSWQLNGKLGLQFQNHYYNKYGLTLNYNIYEKTDGWNISMDIPLFNSHNMLGRSLEIDELKRDQLDSLLELREEIKEVRLEVARTYFNILGLQEECEVIQENIKLVEQYLEFAKIRFEQGNEGEMVVEDWNLQLEDAKLTLAEKERLLGDAFINIKRLTGLEDNFVLDSYSLHFEFPAREEYIASFVKNDIDFRQAESDVILAENKLENYKCLNKPEIKALANKNSNDAWQVSMELDYSLPSNKSKELTQRENNISSARLFLQDVSEKLNEKAAGIYDSVNEQKKRLELLGRKQDKEKRYLEIIRQLQKKGNRTDLDLQKSLVASLQAGLDYTKAQYEYDFSLFKLNEAFLAIDF